MEKLDFDIIMIALPRWDGPYSSTAYSLAKELSRYTRVFYVDNPVTFHEYMKNRNTPEIKRRKPALFFGEKFFLSPSAEYPNLYAVTPQITLPINWLSEGFIYNKLSQLNDGIISRSLNSLIKIFNVKKYIFINSFNPLIGRNLELVLKPLLNVYQSVDDISQAPYMSKHGVRLEQEAITKADFTIVTSSYLRHTKSAFSKNVFLLPNAANTTLFRRAMKEDLAKPPELKSLPEDKKIICYIGNICQRLDYELLNKIAVAHADKILLLIGPRTRVDHGASLLARVPNVVLAGKKSLEELPAYLKYSHCCIIPFLCNQLTKSIYPLKVNEYLSAGKPVVTTNFSEDMVSFREVIQIAENHDTFVKLIQKAIDEDSPTASVERMMFSASNSWEARAHHFIDLTVEFLKQHDRGEQPERRKREQAFY